MRITQRGREIKKLIWKGGTEKRILCIEIEKVISDQ